MVTDDARGTVTFRLTAPDPDRPPRSRRRRGRGAVTTHGDQDDGERRGDNHDHAGQHEQPPVNPR